MDDYKLQIRKEIESLLEYQCSLTSQVEELKLLVSDIEMKFEEYKIA